MTITLVSQSPSTAGLPLERTSESTTNLPYPTSLAANDVLVVGGAVTNAAADSPLGSPWVADLNSSATGGTAIPAIKAEHKVASGSETGNLAIAHHNNISAWKMAAFRGVDPAQVLDVTPSTLLTGSSNSLVLPSITTVTDGCMLVYIAALSGSSATASPPDGTWTELADLTAGTRPFTMAYKLQTAKGATGTVTISWSGSGNKAGILLALRPLVAATKMKVWNGSAWTVLTKAKKWNGSAFV
jgi:hypothetical protein